MRRVSSSPSCSTHSCTNPPAAARKPRAHERHREGPGTQPCPWSMGFQRESRNLPFAAATGKARHSPQGATAGRGSGHESPGRGCKGRGSPLRDGSRESGSLSGRDATPKCCPQPARARCPQANSARLKASVGPNPPTRIRSLTAGPEGGTNRYAGFPCYIQLYQRRGGIWKSARQRCAVVMHITLSPHALHEVCAGKKERCTHDIQRHHSTRSLAQFGMYIPNAQAA